MTKTLSLANSISVFFIFLNNLQGLSESRFWMKLRSILGWIFIYDKWYPSLPSVRGKILLLFEWGIYLFVIVSHSVILLSVNILKIDIRGYPELLST